MEKEKVLAMSRKENKNKDVASRTAEIKASYIAVEVTSVFIAIFYFWQIYAGKGSNDALITIVFALNAVQQWAMHFILKEKKHMKLAVLWTIAFVISSITTIMGFYN